MDCLQAYSIWLFCVACILPAAALHGQSPPPGNLFERCLAYGRGFQQLNQEFSKNREHFAELAEQLELLGMRLVQTNQDMQAIQNETVRKNLQSIELYIREQDLQASIQAIWKSDNSSPLRFINSNSLANEALLSRINGVNLESHFAQLDVAQRATAERRFKLLLQYQDTLRQMNACIVEEKRLADAYIRQCDQSATRCQLELRAAHRMLESTLADNYGARLAKAVTAARLGNTEQSVAELNRLMQQLPAPYSAIALAARLELTSGVDGLNASREEVRLLNSVQDPNVQSFRARAAALQGNFTESLKLCERLMQVEHFQIQALVLASIINSHPRNKEAKIAKSLEQAQLADDLTSGRDWVCTLALALAHAANKNSDKALIAAGKAIELSIGNQRQRCQAIHDALAKGQAAEWEF